METQDKCSSWDVPCTTQYIDPNEDRIIHMIMIDAADTHAEVGQRYGDQPYAAHIFTVCACTSFILKQLCPDAYNDKELKTAILFGAAFHDTIEDARLTYNDVHAHARQYMPEPYATTGTEIVYALTNEKGRTREERANEKYYKGIRDTPYAQYVKLADRLANMKNSFATGHKMYSKYVDELPHFLDSIGMNTPEIREMFNFNN